jgi:hypothetical protein
VCRVKDGGEGEERQCWQQATGKTDWAAGCEIAERTSNNGQTSWPPPLSDMPPTAAGACEFPAPTNAKQRVARPALRPPGDMTTRMPPGKWTDDG